MSAPEKRHPPRSVRMPPELEAGLKAYAREVGISFNGLVVLILTIALSDKKIRSRFSKEERKQLAQLLAALGASHIASNLNQLAKAANSGSLLLTPETDALLKEACFFVIEMGNALLEVLGSKKEDGE